MRDEGEVHDFLHRAGGDHGKARLAARHDVGMVAEDVQRVCGERARRNVHDHGQKFARDLVHIGDHEKEPLRSGVSGRQRACGERAVHGACSAALGLHLCDAELLSPHVHSALGGPLIRGLRHGRGRRDGVDGRYFREGVSDVGGGGIAVDCHFSHPKTSINIKEFSDLGTRKAKRLFAAGFIIPSFPPEVKAHFQKKGNKPQISLFFSFIGRDFAFRARFRLYIFPACGIIWKNTGKR